MAYSVIRVDNAAGTTVPSLLKSGRYIVTSGNTDTPTAIENGNVVKFTGKLISGNRDLEWVTTPAGTEEVTNIGIVASPEICKDKVGKYNISEFTNVAGANLRIYKLHEGDVYTVANSALDTTVTPAVGTTSVVLAAATKLAVATTSSITTETVVGRVIEVGTWNGVACTTFEVPHLCVVASE